MKKILGYIFSTIVGWYGWQISSIIGLTLQENNGSFVGQVIFFWFQLPMGMLVAALFAWGWFLIFPTHDGRPARSHAEYASLFIVLASISSCGLAASGVFEDSSKNPSGVLFYPIAHHFEKN